MSDLGEMSEILEIPPYAPRLEGRRVPYYLKGITRRYKSVCDHWVTRSIWYVVHIINLNGITLKILCTTLK